MPPAPAPGDQDLAHLHTSVGGDLFVKRTPHGTIRHVLRIGPTDPATNTFPIAEIDPEVFDRIVRAENAFNLAAIAEGLSVLEELSVPSSLANIALELRASDPESAVGRLLAVLGARQEPTG